ncbi:MAG: AlkA N-terminal domain-containing protein, partial [Actinomycetota bacterium]
MGPDAPSGSLRLPFRAPLATGALLSFLGDRAIPGIEELDGETFRRSVRSPDGRVAVVSVALTGGGTDATFGGPAELEPALRRLLDLDADPETIDGALSADPALRPLVRRTPGVRVPGAVDGLELAV